MFRRLTVQIVFADISEENFVHFSEEASETYFEKMETLVTSADVILLDDKMITLQGTRAGYFLDINPLVQADRSLDIQDFYPPMWESFMWEDGRWAMPVSGNLILWMYNSQAFDAANLAYPDPTWTIDYISQAAHAFTREENGSILPGLSDQYEDILLRSLLSTTEISNLSASDLGLLENWTQLKLDEAVGFVPYDQEKALFLANIEELVWSPESSPTLSGALLSNRQAGLRSQGLVISSGTAEPQLAYELIKYLSEQAEFANLLGIPARRSIDSRTTSYPSELDELLNLALTNAIPYSQMLNMAILVNASRLAIENGISYSDALIMSEADWMASLEEAQRRRERPIVVDGARTHPQLESDEIALRFGFDRGLWLSVYNEDLWQGLAEEFALESDEVGYVDFNTNLGDSPATWSANYDCVYTQQNIGSFDGVSYLPLNPLFATDSTFDPNDILGSTLEQLQYNGNVIAYPVSLFPLILSYDPSQMPIELADGGWSVSEMLDTLDLLKAGGQVPLALNEQIDMLTISFGGIPIDYRTNPPTVNLVDEVSLNAIQQVLDLARQGLLAYEPLAPMQPATAQGLINITEFQPFMLDSSADWGIKPFPSGIDLNAASYGIGAIYISANTSYYNECYQFARTIAQHPEIFTGMPARASAIDLLVNGAYLEADLLAFYSAYRDLLQSPNTVIIPRPAEGGDTFFEQMVLPYWVHRAYDRYLLENADLSFELEQAQTIIDSYFNCLNDSSDVNTCAMNADPDFGLFGR